MRLNKYLSDRGVCSRREGDRLIEAGEVCINGEVAKLGQRVNDDDEVVVSGKIVSDTPDAKRIYLAYNKPRGIECTTNRKVANNIIDFINYPERIFPVGRLDKPSEGLILLTNDGELSNQILKARHYHEKVYNVKVNKPITDAFLEGMRSGVPILDTVTRPCIVTKLGERQFEITLTQGLNRQIRRMCEYFDYKVTVLKRVRILNIALGDLPVGQYRHLTKAELTILKTSLEKS